MLYQYLLFTQPAGKTVHASVTHHQVSQLAHRFDQVSFHSSLDCLIDGSDLCSKRLQDRGYHHKYLAGSSARYETEAEFGGGWWGWGLKLAHLLGQQHRNLQATEQRE